MQCACEDAFWALADQPDATAYARSTSSARCLRAAGTRVCGDSRCAGAGPRAPSSRRSLAHPWLAGAVGSWTSPCKCRSARRLADLVLLGGFGHRRAVRPRRIATICFFGESALSHGLLGEWSHVLLESMSQGIRAGQLSPDHAVASISSSSSNLAGWQGDVPQG